MKIGILLIATGKYDCFLSPLIASARENFLECDLNFFIFTDSNYWLNVRDDRIHAFYREHKPYPEPTLRRYEMFNSRSEALSKMDYLYYCDVDMRFVNKVGEEILSDRVAVLHPGYIGMEGTPERNPASKAFIPYGSSSKYYAGGFNGGTSQEFLKMSKILDENIRDDESRGITAIWVDESHTNRYFYDNPPTSILTPSYCYPESWNIPYKKILLALDKNHAEMRSDK
jgi:histo-blood group ABO system transferase